VKLSGVAAVAAGGLLGFVSITALGGALGLRRSSRSVPAAETPPPSAEAIRQCGADERLEELGRKESELASRIDELTAADTVARFLPPPDLPARFAGPVVRSAVEDAIARSGLAGRVDEVDCNAFPCLIVGHYASTDELGRVQRGLRQNPQYADDIALVMAMGDDPAGGGALFGAVAFPRGEPRAAEIMAAFKRRRAEVMERRAGQVAGRRE